MKIFNLLFLLSIIILVSSCYTHTRYVYTNEPVYDVYTYDDYFVYRFHTYDPFWRYDAQFSWYYDNFYFGLNFYSPRYYGYPYHYYFKPHRRHHVGINHHYRPKRHLMTRKTNIKHRQKDRHSVPVKRHIKRKPYKPGHKSGHSVQPSVPVKKWKKQNSKKRVHRTPTFKKRVQNSRKNTHVFKRHTPKNTTTHKTIRSTKRTNNRSRHNKK